MKAKLSFSCDENNKEMARIVYDARHFGPGATGIGRYSHHLLDELQKFDHHNEYLVFLQRKKFEIFAPTNPNFKKVLVDAPIYSVKEQILLPLKLFQAKPDLAHFPHFNVPILYPGKFVVTIHDLIVSDFGGARTTTRPKPIYWAKRLGYFAAINKAIKGSQRIFTPSEYVKNRIVKEYKVPPEKIVVTYEAAELHPSLARSDQEAKVEDVLGRFRIRKPFFLYVGNVYPHKNLSRLLDAVKEVQIQLVVVSPKTVFLERLEKEIVQKNLARYVHLLGYVNDRDLIDLYKNAEGLLFPSLSEGFGLPVMEAMSLGCPVICAKTASLPEVAGEAALFFDPLDSKDIAEKTKKLLGDRELRSELIKKGKKQAQRFSWRKMAMETLSVYQNILE